MIDSDQHLYETRTTWLDHIDPERRDDALRIVDDDARLPVAALARPQLGPVDVQYPGPDVRARRPPRTHPRRAAAPSRATTTSCRATTGTRRARADQLAEMGVDEAIVFPNFGLLWERTLDADLGVAHREHDRVEPLVRDRSRPTARAGCIRSRTARCATPRWLRAELARLERDGVQLAMVAPALVDGRPLSHPDHDAIWRAFVDHGVTPVFHVADQRRPFDDAWYTAARRLRLPPLESVFLWTRPRSRAPTSSSTARSNGFPTCASASSSSARSGCRCS